MDDGATLDEAAVGTGIGEARSSNRFVVHISDVTDTTKATCCSAASCLSLSLPPRHILLHRSSRLQGKDVLWVSLRLGEEHKREKLEAAAVRVTARPRSRRFACQAPLGCTAHHDTRQVTRNAEARPRALGLSRLSVGVRHWQWRLHPVSPLHLAS
jgi:hypothetical protein